MGLTESVLKGYLNDMEAPATYPTRRFFSAYSDFSFYGGVPHTTWDRHLDQRTNTYELGIEVAFFNTSYGEAARELFDDYVKNPIFKCFIKEGKVTYQLQSQPTGYAIIAFINDLDWCTYDTEVLKFISELKLSQLGYIER